MYTQLQLTYVHMCVLVVSHSGSEMDISACYSVALSAIVMN